MARARSPHPPEDMRVHLLDTALRCFATWGYEGTSTRRIAQEADVASGLLYHYFSSKDAILLALFDRSNGQVAATFAQVHAEPDPRRRLVLLVRASADIVRSDLHFWRLSYGVRFQHAVVAGLGERVSVQAQAMLHLWVSLLTEIGVPDPATGAALMFAAVDGVFQHFVLSPEHYPLDAVLDALVRRVVDPDALPSPALAAEVPCHEATPSR